jgi:hypothetical protein
MPKKKRVCADCGGPLPPEGHAHRQVWDPELKQWLDCCLDCRNDDDPDPGYEKAARIWRETHGGEL